jgi:hypothetical protein
MVVTADSMEFVINGRTRVLIDHNFYEVMITILTGLLETQPLDDHYKEQLTYMIRELKPKTR